MSEFGVQRARGLLHERRISQRSIAQRRGCSEEFVSQVLLGQAKPPAWLQQLLSDLLQEPPQQLFTEAALARLPRASAQDTCGDAQPHGGVSAHAEAVSSADHEATS